MSGRRGADGPGPTVVRQGLAGRDDKPRHLQVTLPAWLVALLDDEASRRGVSRKAVINDWLVDRADQEQARRMALV